MIKEKPTIELLFLLGDFYLDDGQYARALERFEQALDMPDFDPSAEVYYNMGFAEHQLDNLPRARAHYRKAIALNPAFGIAYIAIGDLYASAVSMCSGNTLEREDKTAPATAPHACAGLAQRPFGRMCCRRRATLQKSTIWRIH